MQCTQTANETSKRMNDLQSITVEVAYGRPDQQLIIALQVPVGATALQAVIQSGITKKFTGINLDSDAMGIFSQLLNGRDLPLPNEYELREHDRVEIYRPLTIDPKEARLARAKKKAKVKPL